MEVLISSCSETQSWTIQCDFGSRSFPLLISYSVSGFVLCIITQSFHTLRLLLSTDFNLNIKTVKQADFFPAHNTQWLNCYSTHTGIRWHSDRSGWWSHISRGLSFVQAFKRFSWADVVVFHGRNLWGFSAHIYSVSPTTEPPIRSVILMFNVIRLQICNLIVTLPMNI